ncbi:hypothetical protein HDU86_006283 [Geranomyces michiganensis]|nr:hypothetical protein HDU86_006283 [Geranomyces michiganensis]
MPAEIMSSILSFLPFADVVSSRRVCLRWSEALLKHQYRRVVLPSQSRCEAFLETVAAFPDRAPLVHSLVILQEGGYAWLFGRFDLHKAIFALLEHTTNLNEFALDSASCGPHSLAFSPTRAPPFFLIKVAGAVGARFTHLYEHNEGVHDRPEDDVIEDGNGNGTTPPPPSTTAQVAWWAEPRVAMEIPIKGGVTMIKCLPNLKHISVLFTRDWNAGHPGCCSMLAHAPTSLESVTLDFAKNCHALQGLLDAVPAHVQRVHLRGAHLWHHGAVAALARPGRTIEIRAPFADHHHHHQPAISADEWTRRMDAYVQQLRACRPSGAMLRVLGAGDVYHDDLIRISRESEAFDSVHKVIVTDPEIGFAIIPAE